MGGAASVRGALQLMVARAARRGVAVLLHHGGHNAEEVLWRALQLARQLGCHLGHAPCAARLKQRLEEGEGERSLRRGSGSRCAASSP